MIAAAADPMASQGKSTFPPPLEPTAHIPLCYPAWYFPAPCADPSRVVHASLLAALCPMLQQCALQHICNSVGWRRTHSTDMRRVMLGALCMGLMHLMHASSDRCICILRFLLQAGWCQWGRGWQGAPLHGAACSGRSKEDAKGDCRVPSLISAFSLIAAICY